MYVYKSMARTFVILAKKSLLRSKFPQIDPQIQCSLNQYPNSLFEKLTSCTEIDMQMQGK